MKKIISLILVIAMVLPVAIQPVFAAKNEPSYNLNNYVCNHTPPASFEYVHTSKSSAAIEIAVSDIALGTATLFIPDSISKHWSFTTLAVATYTLIEVLFTDRLGWYDKDIYKHPLLGDFWYHNVYYDYDSNGNRVNVACETEREFIGNHFEPELEIS